MKSRKWCVFDHYDIDDIGTLTLHCLKTLEGLGVRDQLKRQKVIQIERKPLLFAGALGSYNGPGAENGFDLRLNDVNSHEEDLIAFGHELGHTFEAWCQGIYFKGCAWQLFAPAPNCLEISETFAEAFGQLWIRHASNRSELEELLYSSSTQFPILI